MTFCVPAVALLCAIGVNRFRRKAIQVGLLGLLLVLAFPIYLSVRTDESRFSDWDDVARAISLNSRPGDAIYFVQDGERQLGARMILSAYPDDVAGLVDIALVEPASVRRSLYDEVAPLEQVNLPRATLRLLVVTSPRNPDWPTAGPKQWLKNQGFRLSNVVDSRDSRIVIYQRD